MKCSNCHNDTNGKNGICAVCSFDTKFGSGEMQPLPIPARSPFKTTKSNQGIKRGQAGTDLSTYSNKKLKLFAKAQISYLLSLAYQGNIPNLIKRLHLLQGNLRKGDFLNAK